MTFSRSPSTKTSYLIRYGQLGWVGEFQCETELECEYREAVIVQTNRGLEVGTFLQSIDRFSSNEHTASDATLTPQQTGLLLRKRTAEDDSLLKNRGSLISLVLETYHRLNEEHPLAVQIVDSEQLFDNETVVLYYLGEASCELGRVAIEIQSACGVRVQFQNLIETSQPSKHSSSKGCGGGCSCEL